MTDTELFKYIKHKNDYDALLDNFQYKVEVNDADKRIYCFFEESQQRSDWITNLSAFPTHWNYGMWWVHGGYKKAWKKHKYAILNIVRKLADNYLDYTVCFCGWSYGGAIALLAAVSWYEEAGIGKPLLITFGAPKVALGSSTMKYFRHCISPRSKQYIHRSDPVPLFPLLLSWKHVLPVKVGKFSGYNKAYHAAYDEVEI